MGESRIILLSAYTICLNWYVLGLINPQKCYWTCERKSFACLKHIFFICIGMPFLSILMLLNYVRLHSKVYTHGEREREIHKALSLEVQSLEISVKSLSCFWNLQSLVGISFSKLLTFSSLAIQCACHQTFLFRKKQEPNYGSVCMQLHCQQDFFLKLPRPPMLKMN